MNRRYWIGIIVSGVFYLLPVSFGIHLPLVVSLVLLIALCLGVMIPSAPGFIGTIQFVSAAVLTLFGVSKIQALSFSLVLHACTFVPVTAAGFVCLFAGKVSFGEMRIAAQSKE